MTIEHFSCDLFYNPWLYNHYNYYFSPPFTNSVTFFVEKNVYLRNTENKPEPGPN